MRKVTRRRSKTRKLSARYAAALIRDVKIGPAPGWMQRRLTYAGMRPINNIVDITNFVMLEWGQPLHAFDYDVLVQRAPPAAKRRHHRSLRPARRDPGDARRNKRELSPDNLVIADAAGPIALAGVMGGLETEVTAATKNILLESASFDFVSIRRTMKQFNLAERGQRAFQQGHPSRDRQPAAERAADLMRQFADGNRLSTAWSTAIRRRCPPRYVELKMSQVKRLLGVDFSRDEAARILRALEFERRTSTGRKRLQVTCRTIASTSRTASPILIEELVRIYGYDRLPATLLADRLPRQQTNEQMVFEERIRDILVSSGLQEVITYALTMPEKEVPAHARGESTHQGLEYLTQGLEYLTQGLEDLRPAQEPDQQRTHRHAAKPAGQRPGSRREQSAAHGDVRFFEIGFVYCRAATQKLPDRTTPAGSGLDRRARPRILERFHRSQGRRPRHRWSSSISRALSRTSSAICIYPNVTYQAATAAYLHPGRAATLLVGGNSGDFGQLHPTTAVQFGLGERIVLVGELDVDALQAALPSRYNFTRSRVSRPRCATLPWSCPRRSPPNGPGRDSHEPAASCCAACASSISIAAEHSARHQEPGIRSQYQAADRTLTDKEVDKAHKKIEDRLKHILKAQIRGE